MEKCQAGDADDEPGALPSIGGCCEVAKAALEPRRPGGSGVEAGSGKTGSVGSFSKPDEILRDDPG